MTEKVVKDGKVAVLISPGYGAGWSTWNGEHGKEIEEKALFCPRIVNAVLNKEPVTKEMCREELGDEFFAFGADDLIVEWVHEGQVFTIEEHDGYEKLTRFGNLPIFVA